MTINEARDPTRTLADGTRVPLLGLGVWQVDDGPECENAVRWALDAGYRLIDTAQAYGNEASVGRALRDSGVPREDVFITTKFYPGNADPAAEAENSLRRLGVDHIDLYLIHWPQRGPTWAWTGMQKALERGHARAIGVSNFSIAEIDELLGVADVRPVMNQVQFSAFEYRRELLAGLPVSAACRGHCVQLARYRPASRRSRRHGDRRSRPGRTPGSGPPAGASRRRRS